MRSEKGNMPSSACDWLRKSTNLHPSKPRACMDPTKFQFVLTIKCSKISKIMGS